MAVGTANSAQEQRGTALTEGDVGVLLPPSRLCNCRFQVPQLQESEGGGGGERHEDTGQVQTSRRIAMRRLASKSSARSLPASKAGRSRGWRASEGRSSAGAESTHAR